MRRMMTAGLVVLSACAASTSDGGMDAGSADDEAVEWTGTFQQLRGSNIRGRAVVRSTPEGGTATVTISGARRDSDMSGVGSMREHPWHLHIGECGTNRPTVGSPEAYPLLRVSTDGTARSSATVPVALEPGTEYHIDVHLSAAELAPIIACARLRN